MMVKKWVFTENLNLKTGLHVTICRSDLSAQQYRSANRTCFLTPDSQQIRENENRPDQKSVAVQQIFVMLGRHSQRSRYVNQNSQNRMSI